MMEITDCSVNFDKIKSTLPEKGDIIVMRVKDEFTMNGELMHYLVIEDRPNSLFTLLNIGKHGKGNLMSTVYTHTLYDLVGAILNSISKLEFVEIIPSTEFDSWSASIVDQQKAGK